MTDKEKEEKGKWADTTDGPVFVPKIETDKETYNSQQKEKKLFRWGWGEPLRVSFRWAKNSPHFPAHAGDWKGAKIRDRSVTYEYKNLWSLIHLLVRQSSGPEDFDRLEDPKPHTLKFLIQSAEWDDRLQKKAYLPKLAEARLFVRIVPKTLKKKQAIELPVFPIRAPQLNLESNS